MKHRSEHAASLRKLGYQVIPNKRKKNPRKAKHKKKEH